MESILEFISALSAWQVHAVIFGLILASGLCLFTEDLAVVIAGLLVYQGVIAPVPAVLVCVAAVLVADSMLFGLGVVLGEGALRRPWLHRLVGGAKFEQARSMAARRGRSFVPIIRFLPGLRAPLFFACGTLGLSFRRFLLLDALAALVEISGLLALAAWAGGSVGWLTSLMAGLEQVALLVAAAALSGLLAWLIVRRTRRERLAGLAEDPA